MTRTFFTPGRSSTRIVKCFDVSGPASGRLQVAIPYATVEPVKKLLTSPPRQGSNVDERFCAALARDLEEVEVELRVEMGKASMNLSHLLELKIGDLLVLDCNETSPLPVYVQGRKKLAGSPRVSNGSLAIELVNGLAEAQKASRSGSRSAAH